MIRLAVLGSTGSVGLSVEKVVAAHPERFEVVALTSYGSQVEALCGQIDRFRPELVAVVDREAAREVARRCSSVRVVAGPEGLVEAAAHPDVDRVVSAIVGSAGLEPAYAALEAGKDLALANKESLVVGGGILTRLATRTGAAILPVDSEHAALHQSLVGHEIETVRRVVLTASGGAFRDRDPGTLADAVPEEALRHPTWEMGAKITIDSATLMNKGLELIEASHLFGLPVDRLDAIVHPQSIVHSLVEFRDGAWLAQLSVNDMIFPVQYALSYPQRWENEFPRLDLAEVARLEFRPVDHDAFPAVRLAKAALAEGDSATAVLNGANEEAVLAFLDRRLDFPGITAVVAGTLESHVAEPVGDLETARSWNEWGRIRARETIARRARRV